MNEEDVVFRRGNTSTFSASGRTNTSVRFDVVETKPGINIEVPHLSEADDQSQNKLALDDDDVSVVVALDDDVTF